MLNKKTILITGASGYIGSELVDKLLSLFVNIIRVSRSKLPQKDGVEDIILDLSKPSSWVKIVKVADIIIHLSGDTSVYTAEKNPDISLISNVLPVDYLIKAAIDEARMPKVVFASTATVYGITEILPVKETATKNPITVYDLHKLFVEQRLAVATENRMIDAISLRLSNVYGPSKGVSSASDRGVLNKIINMALQGESLTIYGDGSHIRDYVYIDDVVDAFVLAADLDIKHAGSYNIASQNGFSLIEVFTLVADKVKNITGRKVDILYSEWPKDISLIEKRNFIGNISKYKSITGWLPKTPLIDGLNKMIH